MLRIITPIFAMFATIWGDRAVSRRCAALYLFPATLLVLLGVSYLGEWTPLADALAVFRPHLSALAGASAVFVLRFGKKMFGASLAIAAFTAAAPVFAIPSETEHPQSWQFALYQKNLLFSGDSPKKIAADIARAAPDFVTLQEISEQNFVALNILRPKLPNQVICRSNETRGVALLTTRPIVAGTARCYPLHDLALAQVELGARRVWVVSVHLLWPFPFSQHAQAREIADVISDLDGQVIVAGDFNMVREGESVKRIERAAQARAAGAPLTTFPMFSPIAPLAIDHVLLPAELNATVETRPLLGSDHYGLLARFSM